MDPTKAYSPTSTGSGTTHSSAPPTPQSPESYSPAAHGDIRAHGRMSPSSRDVERSIGAQLRHHTFSPTTVANPGGRQEQCEMSDYPARQLRGDPVKDLASSSKDLKATLESLSASFKVGTRPSTFTPTAQTQQSKTPSSTSNYGQPTSMYKAGMMHGEQAGSPNKSPVNRSVLDSSPKTLPVVAAEVSRYTAAAPETANQKQQLAHHGESEGSWYNAPGAAAAASAAHDGSTSHWDQRETVSSASKSSAFSPQEHKSAVSFTDLVDRPVSPTGGWGVSEVRPGTKMEVPIGRVFFKEIPVPVEKIVYKEVPVPYEVPGPVVERFREVPVDRIIVQEKIVNVERFITKEVAVYIDRFVEKEVPVQVPVDRIVQHEVPVYVDRIIEKISVVEVPRERVVTQEVPVEVTKIIERNVIVEVDKIVTQDVVHEVTREIPVEKVVEVPVERIVERVVEIPVEKVVHQEVPVYVDRLVERPGEIKYVEIVVEKIVEKIVEIPIDRVVIKEVPVTVVVERVITKEVAVPVETEKIVTVEKIREVPIEKFIVQEKYVEVPVERIVCRDVEVPVEKIVVKEVEIPVERIVVKEVPVPVEKIVIKEVPVIVEQVVIKEVPMEQPPPAGSQQQPPPPPRPSTSWRPPTQDSSYVRSPSPDPWSRAHSQGGHVRDPSPAHASHVRDPSPAHASHVRSASPDPWRAHLNSRTQHHRGGAGSPQPEYPQPPHAPRGRSSSSSYGGRRVGLGLALERSEDGYTIVHEAIPGFAAHTSRQVQVGDAILRVDGEPVEGWSLEEIKKLTVGEEGTPCSLTLQRVHDKFEITLLRVYPSLHGAATGSWEGTTKVFAVGAGHGGRGGDGIIG